MSISLAVENSLGGVTLQPTAPCPVPPILPDNEYAFRYRTTLSEKVVLVHPSDVVVVVRLILRA